MAKKKTPSRKTPAAPAKRNLAAILNDTLEQIMGDYYQGNRIQLFHAIIYCGRYGIVLPPYIRHEVEEAFRRYNRAEVMTLGEAFGIGNRVKDGKHLEAERKRIAKEVEVYREVKRQNAEGIGISPELFHIVGKPFGISGGVARRYYYEVERYYSEGK